CWLKISNSISAPVLESGTNPSSSTNVELNMRQSVLSSPSLRSTSPPTPYSGAATLTCCPRRPCGPSRALLAKSGRPPDGEGHHLIWSAQRRQLFSGRDQSESGQSGCRHPGYRDHAGSYGAQGKRTPPAVPPRRPRLSTQASQPASGE